MKERREQKRVDRKRPGKKSEEARLEMRAGAKRPKTSHNQEEPNAKVSECLAGDPGAPSEDGLELVVL